MSDKKMPMSPALQIAAGGYLIYTAWKLREALAEKPLFIIAIIFFALAGVALVAFASWRMIKGDTPQESDEPMEENQPDQE